jgi:hypothetical protein
VLDFHEGKTPGEDSITYWATPFTRALVLVELCMTRNHECELSTFWTRGPMVEQRPRCRIGVECGNDLPCGKDSLFDWTVPTRTDDIGVHTIDSVVFYCRPKTSLPSHGKQYKHPQRAEHVDLVGFFE